MLLDTFNTNTSNNTNTDFKMYMNNISSNASTSSGMDTSSTAGMQSNNQQNGTGMMGGLGMMGSNQFPFQPAQQQNFQYTKQFNPNNMNMSQQSNNMNSNNNMKTSNFCPQPVMNSNMTNPNNAPGMMNSCGNNNSGMFMMQPNQSNSNGQQQQQQQQQAPMFTVQQLQYLQKQLMPQYNKGQNNGGSNQPTQSPYMVLTQLPVSSTPFANTPNNMNNNNGCHNNSNINNMMMNEVSMSSGMSCSNNNQGQQQQQITNNLGEEDTNSDDWESWLQPTPIDESTGGFGHDSNNDSSNMQQLMQQLLDNCNNSERDYNNNNNNNRQVLQSRVEPVPRSQQCWNNDNNNNNNNNTQSLMFDQFNSEVQHQFNKTPAAMDTGKRKFDQPSVEPMKTANSVNGDDDDDNSWTPTPLAEIRAKQLHRQQRRHQEEQQQNPQQHMSINMNIIRQQQQHQHQQSSQLPPRQPTPTVSSNSSNMNMHHPMNAPSPVPRQPTPTGSSMSVCSQTPSLEQQTPPMSGNSNHLLLPSTLLPPSVMTSFLPPSSVSGISSKNYKKRQGNRKSARVESPQDVLERILSLRGYVKGNSSFVNMRIKSEDSNYDTTPSPLQLASFGTELVKAIHMSDVQKLKSLLESGLSPNPCNQFRDSIIDLVCKRGNGDIFKCLVEHGCELRVCDGFGRTPLHHCCWASDFSPDIVTLILQKDPQQLLMEDKRGQTPLEYVRPDHAQDWIDYLEDHANQFFPVGGSIPPAVQLNRQNLPDPPNALPVPLAAAVSSGRISTEEVANMDPETKATFLK